jgi:hypothetical protein
VASLRIPTTLQCTKADANPTHPCAIMLSKSIRIYFSKLSHSPAHSEWSKHSYIYREWDLLSEVSRLTSEECDRKLPYRPQLGRIVRERGVRDRDVDVVIVPRWCEAGMIASVIL